MENEKLIRCAKHKCCNKKMEIEQNSSKKLWKFANEMLSTNGSGRITIHKETRNDEQITNIFNKYFINGEKMFLPKIVNYNYNEKRLKGATRYQIDH